MLIRLEAIPFSNFLKDFGSGVTSGAGPDTVGVTSGLWSGIKGTDGTGDGGGCGSSVPCTVTIGGGSGSG